MLKVIIDGILGRRDGLDTFGLALFDDTRDILGDVLAHGKYAAMADGAVGAEECWGHVSKPNQVVARQSSGTY